ncbi:hypothetical protein BFW38_13780 [Terasakiispira papahanaumokuakeensis]|uniref:HTH araC/xylS-type domain-containing protein n=1 Tax=Terasakiispira papahanaumokuakeensis TaxID=197479 RepID=A0A1E2VC70_9GAMM|nr:AraC family transcriptional regulator [Terasakiispira papahanaumokuakeensis]ODC04442.1 hypothetical protein BFW38_13780 [Terasakiispira papahanaumokuakeensis]
MEIRSLTHASQHHTQPHQHHEGQLIYLEKGLIQIKTPEVEHIVTSGALGWLPPGTLHQALTFVSTQGWILYLPHDETQASSISKGAPNQSEWVQASKLSQALVMSLIQLASEVTDAAKQARLQLIWDEWSRAPTAMLTLPMPRDTRLCKIALNIQANPATPLSQADWANRTGISPRHMSRLFQAETGFNFIQWRQQARLIHALALLQQPLPIAAIAEACGYAHPSTLIQQFKQRFGQTPGDYRAQHA